MQIVKATNAQKKEYASRSSELYPLYGYVMNFGGLNMIIEYLGEGKDKPNYEVHAPVGCHFAPEGVHTMLAFTLADLRERLDSSSLEHCSEDCD